MAYGFVFPKKGFNTNAAIKDLAWRDDQQVLLARDRQTRTINLSAGTNLDGVYYDLPVNTGVWDFYVYHAYLWAQWGSESKTFLLDNSQEIAFGGRAFTIQTQFMQQTATTGILRTYFRANGSGSLTSNVSLTFSAYICLQTLDSVSISGGEADSGVVGLKISLPGYDVRTCNPKQCSLHSEYTALKARTIGQITLTPNTWNRVAHNYGYEPAYWGYFTGTAGGVSGLVPLGGAKSLDPNLAQDVRTESYVTTDAIYFYSSQAVTVYYYIFADQAGRQTNQIADDNYDTYGLIITQPGADIRTFKPNQLRFCSTYPNFKVHSEIATDGPSFPGMQTLSASVGENDTNIPVENANHYGNRGKVVLCGYETIYHEEWHWSWAEVPGADWDEYINEYGMTIKIHAEGSTFVGSWSQSGGFSGDARWTGDGGSRRWQFYKGGNWNTCDTGWERGYYQSWGYTWYRGNDEWVEAYQGSYEGIHVCWYKTNQTSDREYRQEFVTFTGSNNNQLTGCSRGQDGTQKRSWNSNTFIVPITIVKAVANRPFNYNPAYMAWTVGPFEADGARSLPTGDGRGSAYSVVLSGNTFYYTVQNSFKGENDPWLIDPLPHVYPGCYIKIMYDEIGT